MNAVRIHAFGSRHLGRGAAARGDYARAAAMMEESLALSELRHWGAGERGMALLHLASLSRSMGDTAAAGTCCLQSLQLATDADDWFMLSNGLAVMGGLEVDAGRFSRAACLVGAESAGRPLDVGSRNLPHPSPTSPARYAEDLASTRRALGDAAFDMAWAQGRAMPLQDAARLILTDETAAALMSVARAGRTEAER